MMISKLIDSSCLKLWMQLDILSVYLKLYQIILMLKLAFIFVGTLFLSWGVCFLFIIVSCVLFSGNCPTKSFFLTCFSFYLIG